MQLHHLNLTDLKPAKLNVRKRGGKDIDDLVPSIRSLGLIQPLLVRPNCAGYEVVAGQRRYHALMKLAEDGIAAPVPCLVMEDGEDATAIEASLAEDVARLPMDEIDQYKAFAALTKQGLDVADIAARFGVTERLVTQRLAIANLVRPILTAYQRGEINPATVRLLTMATKAQQRDWLALFKSPDDYAPEGYRQKGWLFGGEQIATSAALFDVADSGLSTIGDLFGEDDYFADSPAFWPLESAAIAEAREAYLADGWTEVIVLEVGEYFPSYDYVDTAKEDGGKVYIQIAHNGEVTIYEGQLSRKDIRARERQEAAGTDASTPKPELTKAMQTYLALHRHAAVRADVLDNAGVALRLIAAHMIAGSGLWKIRPEPQKADKTATAESLADSPLQIAFEAERNAVASLLGLPEGEGIACSGGTWDGGRDIVSIFTALMGMDEADIIRILTLVMAETLEADTALIEYLGVVLGTDPSKDWSPDEAFFDLLRDKPVINAMLAEAAGESAAKANLTATAKVQKGLIRDCLSGVRTGANPDWTPRYMAFPMRTYTERGGIRAVELTESLPTFSTPDDDKAQAA